MASASSIPEDNSWISRYDQKLLKLETLFVIFSGFAVAALVVLAVVSVIGRGVFNQPLRGYIDWIQQLMPLIACTGIAYTLRYGTHIRMDMLVNKLTGRTYYLFELITTLLTLVVMALLAWGAYAHFERSFDIAMPLFSRDSSIDLKLPLWPVKLMVAISFMLLCVRSLLQIAAYTKAVIYNPPHAVAVPLVQTVSEQAKETISKITQAQ